MEWKQESKAGHCARRCSGRPHTGARYDSGVRGAAALRTVFPEPGFSVPRRLEDTCGLVDVLAGRACRGVHRESGEATVSLESLLVHSL